MRGRVARTAGCNLDRRRRQLRDPSRAATRVDVCLYDSTGKNETARLTLPGKTGAVHHGFVEQELARVGTLYGIRVHGAYDPREGYRFNANKLLIDPWARDIVGDVAWHPSILGYDRSDPEGLRPDLTDSAPRRCRAAGSSTARSTGTATASPRCRGATALIYELHVKGFTQLHPQVPPEWRGKYLGLTVPAVIDHLKSLGVTAVELMPVHAFTSEGFLHERGLTNYWGYNTLAWFAPSNTYAVEGSGGRVEAGGEGPAQGRHRGDARRGLQPYGRRQRARTDAQLQGHRQPGLLLPSRGGPALLRRRHRLRQHRGLRSPDRAGGHPGLVALFRRGVPHRRFPLRSRDRARARSLGIQLQLAVLRDGGRGSGAGLREAHRRALGRGPGRLPARQFSAGLERVERPLPRHHARVLARRPAHAGRLRRALRRFERPVPAQRPQTHREHQFHRRARRLHAARHRVVQRAAQRGEPREQPRRTLQQPELELRRRRSDRRRARHRVARAARCATC